MRSLLLPVEFETMQSLKHIMIMAYENNSQCVYWLTTPEQSMSEGIYVIKYFWGIKCHINCRQMTTWVH